MKSIEEYFVESIQKFESDMERHSFYEEDKDMSVFTNLFEAAVGKPKPYSTIIKTELYPRVEAVLKTAVGDRQFKTLVGKFMDKNHHKIHTIGPKYQIVFRDEKKEFFDCFQIQEKEVKEMIQRVVAQIDSRSKFLYLNNNPIFFLFYCVIRFYHLAHDEKGLNTALAIYALAVYPSVFSLIFKYPPNEGVMLYTIEHLSQKFIIKREGDVFGMLFTSICGSFKNCHVANVESFTDGEIISFIERVHNDQKSLMKNIADEYMKNFRAGLRTSTNLDSNMGTLTNNEINTDTSIVETVADKVSIAVLTTGLNLKIVSQARSIANISLSDTKFYMGKILTDDHASDIKKFIQAILMCFFYEDHYTPADINSKNFLVWAMALFRKTNSKDENIRMIKDTLDKWGDDVGIHAKFKHVATIINYKKAIFFYFILCIQNYN